jgi:hypothetical protein
MVCQLRRCGIIVVRYEGQDLMLIIIGIEI